MTEVLPSMTHDEIQQRLAAMQLANAKFFVDRKAHVGYALNHLAIWQSPRYLARQS